MAKIDVHPATLARLSVKYISAFSSLVQSTIYSLCSHSAATRQAAVEAEKERIFQKLIRSIFNACLFIQQIPSPQGNQARERRKSTGPKTEPGKTASSRNALKEGFTASFAIVAPEEDPFYEQFLAGHRAEIQPEGALEEDLRSRLTLAAWGVRRIEKLTLVLYEETGVDPLASDDHAVIAKLERVHCA